MVFSFFKKKKKLGQTLGLKVRYRSALALKQKHKPAVKPTRQPKLFTYNIKTNRKVPLVRKSILFLFISAIISTATYFSFFSNVFLIKNYQLNIEEENLDKKDLIKYLSALIGKNLILVNKEEMETSIFNLFPEAAKAEVKKNFPDSITLDVKTYPVAANVINRYGKFEKKFLINKNGTLVAAETEDPSLPYILINAEKAFSLKINLISKEKLEAILLAHNGFIEKFNLKVFYAEYKIKEREAHLYTEKKFMVWLDLEQKIEAQLNKLKDALAYLDIYKISLEYVDLRIPSAEGERIYFKRK